MVTFNTFSHVMAERAHLAQKRRAPQAALKDFLSARAAFLAADAAARQNPTPDALARVDRLRAKCIRLSGV